MMSAVLSWVLGLLKVNKIYLIIGAIALVALASGSMGYKIAKAKYVSQREQALQDLVEAQVKVDDLNQRLDESIRKEVAAIRKSNRKQIEKVVKYVEVNPDSTNCKLDDYGLQLWNSTPKN